MPVPASYGDLNIKIDVNPEAIWNEAKLKVIELGKSIAGEVNGIHSVWENLKVGWVGDTSEEADAFNQQWNQALTVIFGKDDDPKSGVLTQVAAGIEIAAMNYAGAESVVTKMFNDFTAQLNKTPDPNAKADPHRDIDNGPISENTPG